MNRVLIGNLLTLSGCLLMVAIGFIPKKEKVLTVQCFQMALMSLGHLALGAVSGCIASLIGIVRNLTFSRKKSTVFLKILFIVLQLVCSLPTLNGGAIEWIPVFAAGLFVWFLDTNSDITLKVIIIVTQVMWLIYDFYYHNYVAVTFDALTLASNGIGLFMVRRNS